MTTDTSKLVKYILENYKDDLQEIAEHGCSAGFNGLTYMKDTCMIYDKFSGEIHETLATYLEDTGSDVPKHIIESLNDACSFQNYMTWFAVETIADRYFNKE